MRSIWMAMLMIMAYRAQGAENWRPDPWMVQTDRTNISYLTAVGMDKEYGMPAAKIIEHKVKWLQHPNDAENTASLGYLAKVSITAATITPTPLSYDVHFEYALLDKDGFNLATLTSPSHDLTAGITNPVATTIQNVIQGCANRVAVENTVKIVPRLIIEKRTTGSR